MNTIISIAKQIIALDDQRLEGQILPSTAMDKARLKAEQIINKYKVTDTLLCEICKEIGVINNNDLTVNLECAKDE